MDVHSIYVWAVLLTINSLLVYKHTIEYKN